MQFSPLINTFHVENKKLKINYETCKQQETDNFQLITEPFKVLKFVNFIQEADNYIEQLTKEVLLLEFHRKDNDLYSLSQTGDLSNINSSVISSFLKFLKTSVQPLLGHILGIEFNGKISSTASLYEKGDYLLCHDDLCEDRRVAFVYYLTENGGQGGGNFEMFSRNDEGQPTAVSVSVPPSKNSFLCFEVSNYSYHQVSEIWSKKFKRLSINGWFHGKKPKGMKALKKYHDPIPFLQGQTILQGLVLLDQFVNLSYCTPTHLSEIRGYFENESEISLPGFFTSSFYNSLAVAIKDESIEWVPRGAANRRNYCIATESTLKDPIESFVNILKSSLFISFLRNASGLSLEPYLGDSLPKSQLFFEIQKWSAGSYSMVTDGDEFFNKAGLDVFIFFNAEVLSKSTKNSGYITYVAKDEDRELLTIVPQNNALHMVYRTSDTLRFTKYIIRQMKGSYYCICMTFYEPDECN